MRRIVAILILVFVACACANAEETTGLSQGNSGDEVEALQNRLIYLGFMDTEADGQYGPATALAVGQAQEVLKVSCGFVSANGDTVSPECMELLFGPGSNFYKETLSTGSSGSEVLRLQRVLCKTGFLTEESLTGTYGEKTFRAVYAFQMQNGLKGTGIADQETQENLYNTPRQHTESVYVAYGETADEVLQIQNVLWQTGYLDVKPDGQYGPATRQAVALFLQEILGIEASGEFMDTCLVLLVKNTSLVYEEDYELGDEHANVARILRLLSRYGYYDGEIMTEFSRDVAMAVRYFQQTNQLPLTGKADRDTQVLLYSARVKTVDTPAMRTLTVGDMSQQARDYQNELIRLGFMMTPADGIYGTQTESAAQAMIDFLAENGYPAAAEWGPGDPRVRQLIAGDITTNIGYLAEGSKGAEVFRMQMRLNAMGYLSRLKIDGVFGEDTTAAIAKFQEMNGLPSTGRATKETQDLLYSKEALQRQCPWRLEVSLADQRVYAYRLTEEGVYQLEKTMLCSTGLEDSTPRGVFIGTTGAGSRWHYFEEFDCWAQFAYFIEHDIMFHSVIYDKPDEKTLRKKSVTMLGSKASHGCVRLSVEDAKWIYTTCPSTTVITIY